MKSLLEAMSKCRIVVVGDIILDHYIWGDTQRVSPEAPVLVVDVSKDSYRAGGAANVALNIRSLGGYAALCGCVGRDAAAESLCGILSEAGVGFSDSFTRAGTSTMVKTRVMVRNQQLCRLDRTGLPSEYSIQEPELIELIFDLIAQSDGVILSDYAKGVLCQSSADRLLEYARKVGKFVAYDPKPRRGMLPREMNLMTPNRAESLQLAGIALEPGEAFPEKEVCKIIWEKYRPEHLVITLGSEGMLLSKEGNCVRKIPTYAREVFDVSGAGDTVIASLTLAMASGASLEEAAHLANTAAGVVVGKIGTATATPEEILEYHP
ncbi:MAG: hypothetical protein B7X06_02940 [Verrucomicrobia bacterium 21-51-4]|nr:MAG: hypothetical protein B7X06_02940 [Verrucomicrobia bacterium 21-51-4]HQU08820.1 PfkB family carbohydrate kinase [Opitutales bacterium]